MLSNQLRSSRATVADQPRNLLFKVGVTGTGPDSRIYRIHANAQ